MKRILALTVLALTVTLLAGARTLTLHVAYTTDVHGNYFPYNFITRTPGKGSLARVSSAVNDMRSRYGNRLVLLDNGDILQGQPSAYYYNYADTLTPHLAAQMLNYMGYDAANVGNHDVETGLSVLNRYSRTLAMPVLGANIIDTATGNPAFTPYKVIERDGVKLAILGMITPAIPVWLPEKLWKGLRFDDMEATARKWIPIIRERENPDAIIGLFHSGQGASDLSGYRENASEEVARNVPGFDAVLTGHDHRRDLHWIANAEGDSVLLINPANNALLLPDIAITFDIDSHGNVTGKKVEARLIDMSEYEPDEALMKRFDDYFTTVSRYVDEPVADLATPITTRDAFFGPSAFVDLIHKMQLDLTGADISFAAPLAYDATIPAGEFVMGDMFSLYKYENKLYVMELTGREIKGYLEFDYDHWTTQMTSPADHLLLFREKRREGDAQRDQLQYPSYSFDSAAGIIYEVDVTKPAGEKITIISMADGTPFDPDHTYKVALNSYRGNGGGQHITLGAGIAPEEINGRIVFETARDLRHYLAEYLRQAGHITPQPLDNWRFVPEEMTAPAAARDRKTLFPN